MSRPEPAPGMRPAHPWLTGWLTAGLLWHLVGISATPPPHAAAIYHWSLGLLLFLPALVLAVRERRWLMALWMDRTQLRWTLALLVWSCITLGWASGAHVAERAKVPIFVTLFLTGWAWWLRVGPARTEWLLRVAAIGLALIALIAMLAHPWRGITWTQRMIGFGMLDGPNLSAYAMCAAALWVLPLAAPGPRWRLLKWAALALLVVFVFRTGSRGAWAALLACLVLAPLWSRERGVRWLAVAAVLAVVALVLFDPSGVFRRGMSYRPQILHDAIELIRAHPWGGLGLGTHYQVTVGSRSWTHSHNLFTNVAIETGLPGLLLWMGAWFSVACIAWRHREQPLAKVILSLWVFATVALQVDGPMLLHSPRAEWLITWLPLGLSLGIGKGAGEDVHS